MRARLHRVGLVAAAAAGHAMRLGMQVLPGAAGVSLTSVGVGWWLHQPGAALTVAGVLVLADRVVEYLPRRDRGEGL